MTFAATGKKPAGKEELRNLVYQVISQISGHRADDLEADMYLEMDLGLDSIKMITLMDAIMKCYPDHASGHMPNLFADDRANTVETIEDILTMLEEAWFGKTGDDPSAALPVQETGVNDVGGQAHERVEAGMDTGDELVIPHATFPFLVSYQAVSTITISSAVEVAGPLDMDKLHQAWGFVVKKHPILQAVFKKKERAGSFGDYRLEIVAGDLPPIPFYDLGEGDKSAQHDKLKKEIEARLDQRLDLFQWPLHRIEVFRTGSQSYALLLTIAHVVSDGLSNQQLIRELVDIYGELLAGGKPDEPQWTTVNWNETVAAMNRWQAGEELAFLQQYAHAQGNRTYLFSPDLPGDGQPSPANGGQAKAGIHKAWADEQTTVNLQETARLSRTSLFTIVAAAYLMTAKSYDQSGQDIILNIPTGGRSYPNADATGMIGAFAQNMSLTFNKDLLTGGTEMLGQIYEALSAPLMSGMDRAMVREAATSIKEQIQLVDGQIPETTASFIRSSLKSNLYLSFVGDTNLRKHSGPLEVTDYGAYTCTNRQAIDCLVELVHGKIVITANYDRHHYDRRFIEQFVRTFLDHLGQLAQLGKALSAQAGTASMGHGEPDPAICRKLCALYGEMSMKTLTEADLDKDLDAELGMDSLERIRLIAKIGHIWGASDRDRLFKCRSLGEMATVLTESRSGASRGGEVANTAQTAVPYVHIIQQCKQTPDAIAVLDPSGTLTYQQLHEQSNRLAHYLRAHGAHRNTLVGLMVNPGMHMLVGLLGILKSGAAYVPIDPDYPESRIRTMVEHSEINLLLTEQHVMQLFKEASVLDRITCLSLDDATGPWRFFPSDDPAIVSQPDDLMTVLYTSGSTGKPKGVMLKHEGYMNRLVWHQHQFQTGPGERIAQKTSCCFDISIWELLWPLMYGATVCPLDRGTVRNPWKLAAWIRDTKINVIHFVPSLFAEFVHAIEAESVSFPDLRWILFSGEVLPKPIVKKWADHFGTGTKLANLYGPTEASIDVTCHMIDPGEDFRTDSAFPIGKPIDGVAVKILDDEMNELPPGQVGELWIGGIQLAKGYLKDESRTEEAFRPNRFADIAGDMLYRTGDYASLRSDGTIDYHGRKDHQIKIRGFRVELGEIEAALMRHQAVREAAVVPYGVGEGTKLFACLTGAGSAEADLRHFLARQLPDYMLPHRLVWLDQLPKNHNGKLDRNMMHEQIRGMVSGTGETDANGYESPLAPAQSWLMRYFDPPYLWAGYTRFTYKQSLDPGDLNQAVQLLMDRHEVLRSRLVQAGGHWKQAFMPRGSGLTVPVEYQDGRQWSVDERESWMTAKIQATVNQLQVDKWPLWKLVVLRVSDASNDIAMIGHHLISDVVTNHLLFRDLWRTYGTIRAGGVVEDREAVPSFRDFSTYAEKLKQRHQGEYVAYWTGQFPAHTRPTIVAADHYNGANNEQSATMERFVLDMHGSKRLLGNAKKHFDSPIYPILLAPLYQMVAEQVNQTDVVISHRVHGRDLGERGMFHQTAGNFAVNFPLAIACQAEESWSARIRQIAMKLKQMPLHGVSYDLIGEQLPARLYPDDKLTTIRANYLGNRDLPELSVFAFSDEQMDRRYAAPEQKRISVLEFFFSMRNGLLHLDIEYSSNLYKSSTIRKLGERYLALLHNLLDEVPVDLTPVTRASLPSAPGGLLADKTAVVTGAGRGIGRGIAIALAKEGARVALIARSRADLEETASEIRAFGGACLIAPADASRSDQVESSVAQVMETFGQVDILINNAGVTKIGPFLDLTDEDWERIIRTNLFGTLHYCRAVLPHFIKQKSGKIINMGSDSSLIGYPLMSAYACSKHALLGLTRSMAEEYKQFGIQVNAICPAFVNTDMTPAAFRTQAIPVDQIAEVALFLSSSKSDAITGEAIRVFGTQDMYWFGSRQIPALQSMLKTTGMSQR